MTTETSGRRPEAVILTVGDELLIGDRTDTNAGWIAGFLDKAGFSVQAILTVGDSSEAIGEALSRAVKWAPGGVVIVTGGLGPTTDDVTREAVAAWFGVPLKEDPSLREELEARFRARGFSKLPTPNLRLTQVPQGAEILPNSAGTAPGLAIQASGDASDREAGWVFLLPGVPVEMKVLMETQVGPRLDRVFVERPAPLASVVLQTSGIPESALAEALEPLVGGTPGILLQYRPSWDGVELRVSSVDGQVALDEFLAQAEPVLSRWRYRMGNGSLAGEVLRLCGERGWTLATAESCTGGLLGARLTEVPGSSTVFLGGAVAYANAAKSSLLGVDPVLLERFGAVSEPVARAMAEGALRVTGADLAVSITGVAGPGGGSPHRPVGTVCLALARAVGDTSVEQIRFPGGREEIRHRAVQHALRLIYQVAAKG